jgi:hypothetical protein
LEKKTTEKPLPNLTKTRREIIQIVEIRNEKGKLATNNKEIQGIIRDHFENLHSNTLEI